ncbi:ATPase-activating ribosome biosynthesis protein [Borealophlyctis nickersoniae]|nr:ATPase-activating ribosome biosynthesis protein [Borealophlyctis nickersoniae]
MKRNPRKVKWTKAFRRAAGKEMTIVSFKRDSGLADRGMEMDGYGDSTLEFEKRRNIPVRYDRDLMATTIKAMKRVAEIKALRERKFAKNKLKGKKEKERAENVKQIQQNIDLVEAPSLKEKLLEHKIGQTESRTDMEMA